MEIEHTPKYEFVAKCNDPVVEVALLRLYVENLAIFELYIKEVTRYFSVMRWNAVLLKPNKIVILK